MSWRGAIYNLAIKKNMPSIQIHSGLHVNSSHWPAKASLRMWIRWRRCPMILKYLCLMPFPPSKSKPRVVKLHWKKKLINLFLKNNMCLTILALPSFSTPLQGLSRQSTFRMRWAIAGRSAWPWFWQRSGWWASSTRSSSLPGEDHQGSCGATGWTTSIGAYCRAWCGFDGYSGIVHWKQHIGIEYHHIGPLSMVPSKDYFKATNILGHLASLHAFAPYSHLTFL